jgi:hypothetical protein
MARYVTRPRLGDEGLVLGPMTIIAKRAANRWGEAALAIDGNEDRILALIAVAYWRPANPEAIETLRCVSKILSSRNPALAPILIAQVGLGPVDKDERAAFRLFCTEKLLDAGITPGELVKGLGLTKYSPDQPRIPAGNTGGGQWTSGSVSGDAYRPVEPAFTASANLGSQQPSGEPGTIQVASGDGTPGNNQRQNEQVTAVVRILGLTPARDSSFTGRSRARATASRKSCRSQKTCSVGSGEANQHAKQHRHFPTSGRADRVVRSR